MGVVGMTPLRAAAAAALVLSVGACSVSTLPPTVPPIVVPSPVPACPPSAICRLRVTIASWDSGWLAQHLFSASSQAVVADLNDIVRRECPI